MSSKTKTTVTKEKGKTALVPKLRFPEFRGADEWTLHPLRELTTHMLDGDWIESKDQADSGIRLIQTGNVGVGVFIAKSGKSRYVSEDTFNKLKCTEVFPGDCLISRLPDPAGRSCFLPDIGQRMITAVDCTILRFKLTEIVPKLFLAYSQTDGYFREIEALSSGSTRQRVSRENLSNVVLAVPKLPEQQKIAECLSSVDELIAAQARKLDALTTHKKGLMQQLFPREGETQPRLRFPEFQNAGEWVISELGSLSDVRDGTHDSPAFFPTGRPLVTSKNLRPDGTLDLENVSLISEEDYEQINKRSKVTVGDILFGMIGTIGNPVRIKSAGFAIKNVALIKEVGPLLNSFVVQLLQSGYVAAIFAVLNTGNSQKFIALGKIRGLPVPVPSPAEQQRIADCLSSLDDLIAAQTQTLEALKTHKQGLMQQLFPSPEAE